MVRTKFYKKTELITSIIPGYLFEVMYVNKQQQLNQKNSQNNEGVILCTGN